MREKFEISIVYNYETDETKLKVPAEIKNLPTVHQLDFLQDAIGDLQWLYEEALLKADYLTGGVDLKKIAKEQHKLNYDELEERLQKITSNDNVVCFSQFKK